MQPFLPVLPATGSVDTKRYAPPLWSVCLTSLWLSVSAIAPGMSACCGISSAMARLILRNLWAKAKPHAGRSAPRCGKRSSSGGNSNSPPVKSLNSWNKKELKFPSALLSGCWPKRVFPSFPAAHNSRSDVPSRALKYLNGLNLLVLHILKASVWNQTGPASFCSPPFWPRLVLMKC